MYCSKCNEPMVSGYIQARGEVYFTQQPHRWSFAAAGDDVVLTHHNWTRPTCDAWHCPVCKMVIIDYRKKE